MKKMPTYMLVRKLDLEESKGGEPTPTERRCTSPRVKAAPVRSKPKKIGGAISALPPQKLAADFTKLNPGFKKTIATTFITKFNRLGVAGTKRKPSMSSITLKLAESKKVRRVGILDLGVWIGGLPTLLEKLNTVQTPFQIFEILAPIPGGMVKTPEGMNKWAALQLGKPLSKERRRQMERHVVADEFSAAAEDIRKSMQLDLLVGMTPAMVAGNGNNGGIFLNHFSSVTGRTILLSTTDLRQFAKEAGRPFEAAVGAILLAALLVAVNKKLDYHDDTGCLFDNNASRVSLVNTLKEMHIEKSCLGLMTVELRTTALAMLKVLKEMKGRLT